MKNTAVITGSTGGIGLEVSRLLAEKGWDLILLNRSRSKAENQVNELSESFPDQSFQHYTADLMDLSEVSQVASEIGSQRPQIQALYNVAGLLTDRRMLSQQGAEAHFAVNVLAPYLILKKLRGPLSAGAGSNQKSVAVNFSSSAIKSVKDLDISTLKNPDEIGGLLGAYAKSKLAITMVAEMMKRELAGERILIYSVDPGPTKTAMTGSSDGMPGFVRLLRPILFKSAETQAKKLVDAVLTSAEQGETGIYFSSGKKRSAPSMVYNTELQEALNALLEDETKAFA